MLSYWTSFAVASMLAISTGEASTNHPYPSSSLAAKTQFMNAMRETSLSKDKRERKRRMFTDMYKKAVPVPNERRRLANDDDDDAANNNGDDEFANYGFDISAYSLKYAGCSSISTYSADMAQDYYTDAITTNNQFAIFRFCPSDSCSSSSTYGCMDDYGEYMLPIADWLEIIHDYREEEFQRYCEYCANCYNNDNRKMEEEENEEEEANGEDDAVEEEDANDGDDAVEEEEEEEEEENDDGGNAGYGNYGNCEYASSCDGYDDVCENESYDFSQLFDCVKFDFSDDLSLYVGPHCKSDKSTIVLSIFTDEYCTQYAQEYDLQTLTGVSVGDDALLEYYNTDCIACKESDLPFQEVAGDYYDNDDVSEVCENLYAAAAKCNRHIGGASGNSYQSNQQEDNEYAVCSFIQSVVQGSYDEYGYIYINSNNFASDNQFNEYAQVAIRRDVVTPGQVMGLLVLSLLVLFLTFKAALLRHQVSTKAPKNYYQESATTTIKRQNSGIMMCRSESGGEKGSYKAPTGMLA